MSVYKRAIRATEGQRKFSQDEIKLTSSKSSQSFQILAGILSLTNAETFIIGGEVVIPHSEPHIVSLKSSAPGSHFCAATILPTTHAITAATCYRRYLT